jgi:UDP-N-acetylglucosamine--N-acetylmuramyl-(pentapeptide) pyrophosphoryl-undecaprenol N-acetylglucosamine transferase
VNPALAVVQTLQNNAEILWVGGEGGMETQLVKRANLPYKTIPAAGVHGVGLKALPGNLFRLVRGYFASLRILTEFKPDVLFFTGGFLAVPMALAGMPIPTVLFIPDIEPALALKTLARFADRIAVTAEASYRYFKRSERIIMTGYPTRSELTGWTRIEARQALKLDDQAPVLLVVGGSKGARSINNAVLVNLPILLEKVQVVHITGELDWPGVYEKVKGLSTTQMARYHAYPYLHEQMGAALAAADLVLSRAGASTLGEFPLFGLPAMLVPYPYAWRYQKVNADFLVQHGAAVELDDSKLQDRLMPVLNDLLENPQKLRAMRAAMQSQSHPRAAADIGHLLLALSGERR